MIVAPLFPRLLVVELWFSLFYTVQRSDSRVLDGDYAGFRAQFRFLASL